MKSLLSVLVLSVSLFGCNDSSFPVDYVYGIIDTGELKTSYLHGVMIDGTGPRVRLSMDEARALRLRCVTPEYYAELMYWAGYETEQ